jgi:hypothetical protein
MPPAWLLEDIDESWRPMRPDTSLMTYANETKVPVDRSRAEIEKTLAKFGADHFGYSSSAFEAAVGFHAKGRLIRFRLPLPNRANYRSQESHAQAVRAAWRALALSIKAKVVAVESKIVTFEEEFLAQTVMPDGITAAEHVLPKIKDAYAQRRPVALLPNFTPDQS